MIIFPESTTDAGGKLLESYVEIGTETSDRLEMVAPKLYVERTVRHPSSGTRPQELALLRERRLGLPRRHRILPACNMPRR